jgi:hypothetical protein
MSAITPPGGASIAIELAAIEEDHHAAQIAASKDAVKTETQEEQFQKEQQREAEQRAREKADSASFWDDVAGIAKDVAIVGAVAGAAFTGGSTLIVAATLAGGALTVGGDVARRLGASDEVCTGLELTGAGLSLAAGGGAALFDVAPVATQTSATVGLIGRGVEAGATLVQAGAVYNEKTAQSDEFDCRADAVSASAARDEVQATIDDSLSTMRRELQDEKLKMSALATLQQSDERTNADLLTNMRG